MIRHGWDSRIIFIYVTADTCRHKLNNYAHAFYLEKGNSLPEQAVCISGIYDKNGQSGCSHGRWRCGDAKLE